MKLIPITTFLAFAAGGGVALQAQTAQLAGTTRAELQRHDLSIPGREVIQARVGVAPGGEAARHKHPGEEIVYVLQGSLEYRLDGRPPVTLGAGEVLFVPAGVPHSVRNVGRDAALELATYVVEKGKPLLVPVP
ncbi:cupin domain-containing protein [Sphingomonas crusticola]|uniref:cupin domain-containing protein n=1 Tax=Sphingomonas crusticola TaxID=1697973 RepID=UPI000E258BB3|nr:cupin domain-containing protein [Sphingomonas crusticola]